MAHHRTKNKDSSFHHRIDLESFTDDISREINNLPEDYYQLFMMYYEGYKYYEIAEYLQLPVETVKSKIRETRLIFRERLDVRCIKQK